MLLRYLPNQIHLVQGAEFKAFCSGLSYLYRQVIVIELASEQSLVFISFCDGVQYSLDIQDKLLGSGWGLVLGRIYLDLQSNLTI